MNWDAIGAVGEIIGAAAVIISLLYLAIQIRNSNRIASLDTTRYITEQGMSVIDLALTGEDLMEIMIKDRDSLSEVERAKLLTLGRRMIVAVRQLWLTKDEVRSIKGNILAYHAIYHREGVNYGMRDVWPLFKDANEPEFVQWFEENIVGNRDRET